MTAQAVRLTNVDIDNALKNKHFEVIFQPIFDLKTGSLGRMEAFIRWVHPGLGTLPPGAFISFFESQGRMSELTRYVLETALERYMEWRGKAGPGFSVNLALSDLSDKSFPAFLRDQLLRHDFPPELVTLECPSLPTTTSLTEAQEIFGRLKKTGARLAIEVRGRANDLLRSLSPFPFDEVKTGGSAILRFARTVRGGPGLGAISELLELAKSNDAAIVAVGVEDQASLQALTSLGFTAAQGNHLASVGDLKAFKTSQVNDVRKALELEPLDQKGLQESFEAREPVKKPDPEQPPVSDDDIKFEQEKLAALRAAKDKARAARDAAKRRALKKAADAKAAAQKAKQELEEQQKLMRDAQAKREVEESARKLQDRLNRAYDDDEEEQDTALAAESEKPEVKKTAPTKASGKKTTKSAGRKTATKKPAAKKATAKKTVTKKTSVKKTTTKKVVAKSKPDDSTLATAEDKSALQPQQPEQAVSGPDNEPDIPEAGLLLGGSLAEPVERPAPTEEAKDDKPEDGIFVDTSADPESQSDADKGDSITIGEKADTSDVPVIAAMDEEIVLDEIPESQAISVELLEDEECPPLETLSGDDAKSEDEIHEQFFKEASELPHDLETEPGDVNGLDKALLEVGLRDLAAPADAMRSKSRKNFLQKRYRVRVTGFWPESWKDKWAADKAARDDFSLSED
jgi:EAL domain-containing protein (putative c-di-GMP-specific phosphodiesterase class I)